jgi:hypothetical protein
MSIRATLAAGILCVSVIATGQVSGKFYLEKESYPYSEPIFVYFEARNEGTRPEKLYSADPNGDCTAFSVKVSSDKRASSSSCARGISCLASDIQLMPGEKHTERILLNYAHEINANAYWVRVSRRAPFLLPGGGEDTLAASATLYFHVDESAAPSKSAFQPWVDQLNSSDPLNRWEAARVLASVAPRSWEDLLLTFGDDPYIHSFAPLAFHRLNTPRSIAALKEFAKKSTSGTFEQWQAAAYLANDPCADQF